jgi:hypothetical protein
MTADDKMPQPQVASEATVDRIIAFLYALEDDHAS